MRRRAYLIPFILLGAGILAAGLHAASGPAVRWTEEERATIRSLALDDLPPLPAEPSNRLANDPRAAEFGRALFFDTRLSADGRVACATCHNPERQFQDGTPLARGVGVTNRRTMPIAGTAYSPFLFWDGRKDSLWSQALGPLESPVEHGGDRTQYGHIVAEHYRTSYEAVFGPLPNMGHLPPHAGPVADPDATAAWKAMPEADREAVSRVFANIGKAIAAYERTIRPPVTRFDTYASALGSGSDVGILSADEIAGLRLFIGKGACVTCHNGPLLTDNHFHNTGIPAVPGLPEDRGREAGAKLVREDAFNCLGKYSDAGEGDCSELRFMTAQGPELLRAFKTPSMRGVASRPPYMHAGQIGTLAEVVAHYSTAPAAPAGDSEIRPLNLSETELRQLIAFLATLEPRETEGEGPKGSENLPHP
ncbi:cytochrome-c peroxidase [Microvirga alba]|uniref:Methylamine utilization protein n=1 Tax=Microvirga alba TaxID=2791025 RepID=A0A931FLU3_9HYPH|nr:cytochrome c peroxidase [Microvirga alba]MBF9232444.1 methylamine utilization protein [Microvirga alba]